MVFVELLILGKRKRFLITKFQKQLFYFFIFIFVVGTLYVGALFLKGQYVLLNEEILSKHLKMSLYYILIFLYVRHVYFILNLLKSVKLFSLAMWMISVVIILITLVEYVTLPNAFSALHFSREEYYRVRLLTPESSHTGTIAIIYFVLLMFLSWKKENEKVKYMYLSTSMVGIFVFTITSHSKGFIIVALLTLVVLMVSKFKLSWRNVGVILGMSLLLVIGYYFMGSYIYSGLMSDMEDYTSVATRLVSIINAMYISVMNPLGIGLGAILYYFPLYLPKSISFVDNIFMSLYNIKLNFIEVLAYEKTDQGLGVKSGIFQWLIYGGIVYVIILIKQVRFTSNVVKNSFSLSYINVFVWLSLLIFIVFENKFEIWFWFAFLDWYSQNVEWRKKDEVNINSNI
ncbi:hypothetical protein [Bacillus cereus]